VIKVSNNVFNELHSKTKFALVRYGLYSIIARAGFATPFFVVFMVGNGITFTDLALGTSLMAALTFSLELPSGYVADRFGRRKTMFFSQICLGIGTVGYVFASSIVDIIWMYTAFGIGAAFRSGAGTAWFYDKMLEYEDEDKYTAAAGKLGSIIKYQSITSRTLYPLQ
jgi:MFS family permease